MNLRSLFPVILFLSFFPADAQEAPAPKEEDTRPMQSLTFFIYQGPVNPEGYTPPVEFHFDTREGVNGVSLHTGGMGGPFLRPMDTTLDLYAMDPAPPNPEATPLPPNTLPPRIRRPLLRVSIPEGWRNVFLLVHADQDGVVRAVTPLNQSLDALPEGHLALMNLGRRTLSVKLGDQGAIIEPGTRALLPARPGAGARPNMVLFVAGGRNPAGEMEVLASRKISVNPAFRRLVLLVPEPDETLRILQLSPAPEDPLPPPEE